MYKCGNKSPWNSSSPITCSQSDSQAQLPPHQPFSAHLADASFSQNRTWNPPPLSCFLFLLPDIPCCHFHRAPVYPACYASSPIRWKGRSAFVLQSSPHIPYCHNYKDCQHLLSTYYMPSRHSLLKVHVLLVCQPHKVSPRFLCCSWMTQALKWFSIC